MAEPNGKSLTVPYVPYKTFTSVLDAFVTFLPDEIDVSMWPSYSGGTKSQIIGTLKFLGLISNTGAPSADLRKMSENKDARPVIMAEVLKRSYPALFKLDLSKATPGSFDKVLRDEYKQEGETHRKAASFFLIAAKHAGIVLSPPLTAKGRLAPSKRKGNGTRSRTTPTPPLDPSGGTTTQGPEYTINLANGITLTLSASNDTFKMTKEDRDFVNKLLEEIQEYESENALSDDVNEGEESEG